MNYVGIPVPTKKLENKLKFGQNTEDSLVEWEKNQVKPLFREFDKEKKGIQKTKLIDIMARLLTDECCIGKIPNCQESEFEGFFKEWQPNQAGLITWEMFREGMNDWKWKMMDREVLDEIINDFFARAYKFKMQGKDKESKEMATKALRLQGSLTKTKPIEVDKKQENNTLVRGDQFTRIVHRRKDDMHPDEVFGNSCNEDRSLKHTFKV